ncbi:MAG: NfeD family protein [Christensenellales bacterium]
MWIWIWLGVIVASMLIEILTMEMVSIWFIPGSLIALIMAGLNVPAEYQVITAIAISLVCMLSLRRVALKLLKKDNQKTNLDRTLGEKTKLLSAISEDGLGTVKVNGVTYNAVSENGIAIDAGSEVELVKLDGNKFIVKEIKK